MNHKLNPIVGQILSPIILRFQDSDKPDQYFVNGIVLAEESFDKHYLIDSIRALNDQILLTVKENRNLNLTNWVGEEMVSFFE